MFNVKVDEGTGRESIIFGDCNGRPCGLMQSSLRSQDAKPGSSAVRLGISYNRMHLDRDLVEELVYRLQVWLLTGSFSCASGSEPKSQERIPAVVKAYTSRGDLGKDVLGKPILHTAKPPSAADVLADMERVKYALLQSGLATIHDSLCDAEQAFLSSCKVDSPDSDPSRMRWDINVENEDGVLKLYIDGETTDGSQRVVRELSVHTDGHVATPTGTIIVNLTPGKREIHRV